MLTNKHRLLQTFGGAHLLINMPVTILTSLYILVWIKTLKSVFNMYLSNLPNPKNHT